MLCLACSRPRALRWNHLDHHFRPWIRNASPKPCWTQRKAFASSKRGCGSHSTSNRILRYRPQLQAAGSVAALCIATFLFLHIETTYFYAIDGTYGISMMPTINSYGDGVLISKLYRRGKGVEVGDVVSFGSPVEPGTQAIKRVIGMEGDWVCRDTPGVGKGTMIQVPRGHCWVVGDNLQHSRDSRLWGPLPLALIKGKVLARYRVWPEWLKVWSDFEWLEHGLQPAEEDDVD